MDWKTFRRRMLKSRPFMMGLCGILTVAVLCVLSPLYVQFDAYLSDLYSKLLPPEWLSRGIFGHIFGCDALGRDVFTRALIGGRTSLAIALSVVLISTVIGAVAGICAGYFGGIVDSVISRIGDILMSIPNMLLAACIIAVLGTSYVNLIITLSATSWVVSCRVVRADVLKCKNEAFIQAERVIGASHRRIMFVQILPNTLTSLIISETQHFGATVLSESALSFLGLGIPAPNPSWGSIIADGKDYITAAPWIVMVPGVLLCFTVLSFNFFGDGLRDVLDPRNTD